MTKITPPGTIKDALRQATGILSLKRAAVILGKSESYLYELGNPDSEKNISAEDALALDVACFNECGKTPFTDAMQLALEALGKRARADIPQELLNAQVSLGSLTKAASSARGGKPMPLVDRKSAHDFGRQLISEVEEILIALNYDGHKNADNEAAN
jgi:hypothetical protein